MSELAPTDVGTDGARPRWGAFLVVTTAYMGVTLTESVLAPIYPVISDDLGFDVGFAGIAFGVLTAALGVGNLVGGYLLWRHGPRRPVLLALIITTVGSLGMSFVGNAWLLAVSQALMGIGSGMFFPAGISLASTYAGTTRKGLAMGLFGVAFSGGLTVAALVAAAFGNVDQWQYAFWVSAAATGIALVLNTPLAMPGWVEPQRATRLRDSIGSLWIPIFVATVATVLQYGTVAFFALYAVQEWDVSAPAAAAIIAAGRAVSVAAKIGAGWSADRWGTTRTVWVLGLVLVSTGLVWTLARGPSMSVWAVVIFTASVSAVFPIANLLAVTGFGDEGRLLGAFRFVTMIIGAIVALTIGQVADAVGLQPTLAASVLLPLLYFLVGPGRLFDTGKREASADPQT